jgi:NAD(P)-dependent dehydrogenase (short-subunit alcohol dehydrogenase family)
MATVLITGANKGIGLEMTRLYAARGDRVLACCRDAKAATALATLAKQAEVRILEVQVSDADSVAGLARALEGEPIDLLINNAGAAGPAFDRQTATSMDFDGWMQTFEVNTLAPVRVMQALLPNLLASGNGKVVTITSQMGALALDMPMAYAYCTSKAAVNKFMKLAAVDLAKQGIAVGVVHPGWVKTDMGGPHAEITPEESASGIVAVVDGLSMETTGSFWKWNGEAHAW